MSERDHEGPNDHPGDRGDEPWFWTIPPAPEPPAPPIRRRGRRLVAGLLAGFVLLASGIGIGWGLTRGRTPGSAGALVGAQNSPSTGRSDSGLNAQVVADKVGPAVVDVTTVIGGSVGGRPSFSVPRGHAAGTGMILTSSGE